MYCEQNQAKLAIILGVILLFHLVELRPQTNKQTHIMKSGHRVLVAARTYII
jgi:hypothetical protein